MDLLAGVGQSRGVYEIFPGGLGGGKPCKPKETILDYRAPVCGLVVLVLEFLQSWAANLKH